MSEQPRIDEILVTTRTLENYLDFFDLTPQELRGKRVLDCPGGVASFTAQAHTLGADSVSVDPTYTLTAQEFEALGRDQIDFSDRWYHENPDIFTPEAQGEANIQAILAQRHAGLSAFLADYQARREAYVVGSLPNLPFADDTFDLVLSAHLLFVYSDRFDLAFHECAINEMLRVSRGELRLYPLGDYVGNPPPWFDELINDLGARGLAVQIKDIKFRAYRNMTTAMIIRKSQR